MTRRDAGERPWTWRDSVPAAGVCFAGRGPAASLPEAVRALAPADREPAWLEQVHSAIVLDAVPGCAGRGDALVSRRPLALTVVTADCVPVLLASGDGRDGDERDGDERDIVCAAVHAGWRGVEQRIVPAAVARLRASASEITAWIGPAIGCCCYEVGEEVAARVSAAVDGPERPGLVLRPPSGRDGARPHLDLSLAVARQLAAAGVVDVRRVARCTRCHPDLWSYRRDGRGAGRNLATIWPRSAG